MEWTQATSIALQHVQKMALPKVSGFSIWILMDLWRVFKYSSWFFLCSKIQCRNFEKAAHHVSDVNAKECFEQYGGTIVYVDVTTLVRNIEWQSNLFLMCLALTNILKNKYFQRDDSSPPSADFWRRLSTAIYSMLGPVPLQCVGKS